MDMEFHKKLKRLFHEQDWTVRSLATQSGVSPSTISNWTKGKFVPKLDDAARIAQALGVSLDYLGRDDIKDPEEGSLSQMERRILWLSRVVGYEVAASRLAKTPDVTVPPAYVPDGAVPPNFVDEVPPSPQKPKPRKRRKA